MKYEVFRVRTQFYELSYYSMYRTTDHAKAVEMANKLREEDKDSKFFLVSEDKLDHFYAKMMQERKRYYAYLREQDKKARQNRPAESRNGYTRYNSLVVGSGLIKSYTRIA